MSPRPLYRWKSFWFGILVLGFLGWAWAGSMGSVKMFHFRAPSRFAMLAQFEGRVIAGTGRADWEWKVSSVSYTDPQTAKFAWEIIECIAAQNAIVPHWFLILLFLVLWSGWLAWRWRRLKRWQTEVEPSS